MSVQIISQNGNPEWAVIPYDVYLQLVDQAEMLEDIQDFDRIKAEIDSGAEESFSAEVVYAVLDGQNAIRVYREYRGLTQDGLAKIVGISVPYLSQLEGGKRKGSLDVISRVAAALRVDLELLAGT
ncbi:MAG: helix-turn-helix transcriptional regulator [Anaerolineaceae bacterium]|nr:helix-turn-helix transcriptional regulator [Anaerolineaceae bacterium]